MDNQSGADIYKSTKDSGQIISRDMLSPNGTIEPFVSFQTLLNFWYANLYHQRAIKLKASLLSQVESTTLDRHLPPGAFTRDLLYAFTIDLEMYGNGFLERAGSVNDFYMYNILGYQARIDKNRNIYQIDDQGDAHKIEGFHLKYHSPMTKWYGEPDYLTVLRQIETSSQADIYNSIFFQQGGRPAQAIIFENSSPNEAQRLAFAEFFKTSFKGASNAHKNLVLYTGKTTEGSPPAKVRIEKLNDMEDMSFEKLKHVNRDEIIAAHGVPPRLVGVMSAGQLGNGRELIDQLHAFNQVVIQPKARVIEDFFKNIGIEHKIEQIDVTNFKDDADLVSSLVDRQILTVGEAKELLGFSKK